MLSQDTQTRIIDALSYAPSGNAFIFSVLNETPVDPSTLIHLVVALGSQTAADEVAEKVITGQSLSNDACRRILQALASSTAGNELINAIQITPLATPFKL